MGWAEQEGVSCPPLDSGQGRWSLSELMAFILSNTGTESGLCVRQSCFGYAVRFLVSPVSN